MVEVKKVKVNSELEIDIPEDVPTEENRCALVKDGNVKSIHKGLYEQGIDFRIINQILNNRIKK